MADEPVEAWDSEPQVGVLPVFELEITLPQPEQVKMVEHEGDQKDNQPAQESAWSRLFPTGCAVFNLSNAAKPGLCSRIWLSPNRVQPRRAGGALLAGGGSSKRAGGSKPHSFQFAKNGRNQLISNAQRWVKLDPLHEPAQHQLIALYLTNDQRAEAYRQYQGFVCLLFEELGVEPQPETKALYEAMQKGRAPGLAESPSIFEQEIKFFSSFDGARVRNHTLIRYDERGCGLSDWKVGKISFEAWV